MNRESADDRRYLRRPRFSLAMLFVLLSVCAVLFGILVNRNNCCAQFELLCTNHPLDNRLWESSEFIREVLEQPGVAHLSTVRHRSDPDSWLRSRLTVMPIKNSDVIRIRLDGNTYRDKTEDFVPILNAFALVLIKSLEQTPRSDARIAVISNPTFHQE